MLEFLKWCEINRFFEAPFINSSISAKSKYKNLKDVVFMLGGNLAVGEGDASVIVPKFKNYGFDLVFHQVDLNTGLDELERFLKERNWVYCKKKET